MSATIEEVTDGLQNASLAQAGSDVVASEAIVNRAERKSRKALQGLGLQRVPGISRITMRRARGHLYVINNPEVYKSSTADSYVIFGEGKTEDPYQQQLALQAAQAQQQQMLQAAAAQQGAGAEGDFAAQAEALLAESKKPEAAKEAAEDGDEVVDAEGVNEGDIELVMTQASTTRNRAIKALKAANGDLINAIMEATS